MDDTKDRSLDSESYMDEGDDHETIGIKEEKRNSPVTLRGKEIIESGEKNWNLPRENDPVESVHKYAKRIKSFLGWEPDPEEQELANERVESEDGVCELPKLVDSSEENEDVGEVLNTVKENMGVTGSSSYTKEKEKREGEISTESNKNKSDLTNIDVGKAGDSIKRSEEIFEKENDFLIEQDHRENTPDLEIFKLKEDIVIHNTPIATENDMTKENSEVVEKEDIKYLENNDSDKTAKFPDSKDSTKDASPPLENKNLESINQDNSGKNVSDDDFPKSDIFVEKCDDDTPNLSDANEEDKSNSVSQEPNRSEEWEPNIFVDEAESHVDTKQNKTETETLSISSSKTDLSNKKDGVENLSLHSKEEVPPSDVNEDKIENKNAEGKDAKSEDTVYVDESLLLKNNIQRTYFNEIRRLSRDIVKDIIETARNSVHELYSDKNEEVNTDKILESSRNYDHLNESHENAEKYAVLYKLSEAKNFLEDGTTKQANEHATYSETEKVNEESYEVDHNTVCGYGCFRPKWIQRYATPKAYLALFSVIGVIHGCYYTYVVSVISTLEKRYAFETKISGVLLMADEITPLLFGIIVGYIGGRTHRPRMVALGMFLSVACCFVSGLPYLIYGTAKHMTNLNTKDRMGPEICEKDTGKIECDSDDLPPTLTVIGIFILASLLKGFATLSYYVIGMSYMDDIIKKKNTPIYFAVSLALRLLGPLVGFLMSSAFLKLYENPYDDPGFGPDDPRWIGAWWIGFFLQGVLLLIFTLPIALFPRRLPGQKKIGKADTAIAGDKLKEIFCGLVSALKRLMKNPVFIVLIVNTNMKIFGHFGHAIMLPKYMENQFRVSASEASLYSGATTITCIMISTVLGGFLIWKFRPRIKVLLAGMIISEAILCIGFLTLMIPKCQTTDMLHFGMDEEGLILRNVCNNNCDCSTTSFTPFCGPDGKTTYFSPCYAGCTQELNSTIPTTKNKEFGNCSCIAGQSGEATTISEGFCPDEKCWSQAMAYLIILFTIVAVSNIFTVAHTIILLRSVHPSDKSFALGTFETFICLFGFIPLPVTFGALVDSACLVWEKSCGVTGNCWFYDLEKYNYLLHGTAALFCSLSVICLTVLYFLSGRVRNLYDEEDEQETKDYTDIKLDTVSGSITKL